MDDEDKEDDINIDVAAPGAEELLEAMLSQEMLRIFDASPEVWCYGRKRSYRSCPLRIDAPFIVSQHADVTSCPSATDAVFSGDPKARVAAAHGETGWRDQDA